MKKIVLLCLFTCLAMACRVQDKLSWVAIGDSITYLNDHPDETGRRVEKGYMTRVAEQLPDMQYVNKGYNGWKAADIAARIDQLELPPADIYTVLLGTNDWWSGVPVGTMDDYIRNTGHATLYGSFRIIIDKLRRLRPDARIILMTPLQRSDFVYFADHHNNAYGSYRNNRNGESLATFADAVLRIGTREGITVVDLYNRSGITQENIIKFKRLKDSEGIYREYKYPDFLTLPFAAEDEYPYPVEATDMTYDGLHPSDKGNAVIAKMLIEAMKNI
ncbi:MAG: SGNH/GDSL hydrolase family protein [Tannerella sp.]|jgi:lysophospholipase L1-like esterase|nr:SGNH/GDSL hydrolase family protein [Tannerella sp.]